MRAVLAIGVNAYDYTTPLSGAEIDAQRIHDSLVDPEIGGCDPGRSRLLLSPTVAEVRDAVRDLAFGHPPLDELTVFFAGHGDILPTGFYMALSDYRPDRVSGTAYSLSELFAVLAEARPRQTNIILDACFSGGVVGDLGVLIRPETSGDVGSPAVTLLAMAARDRTAGEYAEGGIATNALVDCLSGKTRVREDVPVLDLYDIGQVVSERLGRTGDQTPFLSALNVHRRSTFCRNPLFQASARTALQKWEPRAFLDSIEPVLATHADCPEDLLSDIERLSSPLVAKAVSGPDVFLPLEIRATVCAALLPYAADPAVAGRLLAEVRAISAGIRGGIRLAIDAIREEPYALLRGRGGLANLFLLPIRLSKLIGWAGAAWHIDTILGREAEFPREDFLALMDLLVEQYSLSMNAMSESQAPALALGLTAAHALGAHAAGELVLSSTFASLADCRARIADTTLDPERILPYLMARMSDDYSEVRDDLAQPTELLTVLLLLAPLYGLEEVFDADLSTFDHVTINAFVADDYQAFGLSRIDDGENDAFMIGHGVWTVQDLLRHWPEHAFAAPTSPAVGCAAILASLLFPDRVPWFVFPEERLVPSSEANQAVDPVSNRSPS